MAHLTIQGSDVKAGDDVTLKADGDINLQAAKNTVDQKSTNSSSSAGVGVAINVGKQTSAGITVSASAARGNADGSDQTWTHTHVEAGNKLTIASGGDTTLKGATASGKQVQADVGGNLNVQSVQDTSTYNSKNQSVSASATFGYGFSGSASASQTKVDANYASVREQSGIKAGDNGFQVNVKGNTDLKGGTISSTQAAVDGNKNVLTTGTLTTSDIQNRSDYKASSVSVSVGTSGGSAGVGQASGSQSSTTKSGVSLGSVVITDGQAQQDKTGQSAEQTVASLNRDVQTGKDTSGSLGKSWDAQKLQDKVQAGAAITAEFGKNAARLIGDYAASKTKAVDDARNYAKYKERQNNGEEVSKTAQAWLEKMERDGYSMDKAQAVLNDPKALADYDNWKEGGAYRVAAHTVVGGLTGGANGAIGAAASSAAAPELNELQRNLETNLVKAGIGMTAAHTVAQLVSGSAATVIGAATGGTSGAMTSYNADMNNRQLHPAEADLIRRNAAKYAALRKISLEQAETELAQQALRQIDSMWAKRFDDNPAAAQFLSSLAATSPSIDVGGGKLFDARGTAAYNDHTINATTLLKTADVYNRLNNKNTKGIVPLVGGAYVAYSDAANDPKLVEKSPQEILQLMTTGGVLKKNASTAQEGLAILSGNLGISFNVFNSGKAKPGDGSLLTDYLIGAMGVASLTGLPGEGGAVTTPTRGMARPMGPTGPELPTTTGNRVNGPARVTVEVEVGGNTYKDTNQAHRPIVAASPDEPTLISDSVSARALQTGKPRPNGDMATAHGEIGGIQQAWKDGKTQGQDMVMNVEGKDVCGYCKQDIAAAAEKAGLKSLTVNATSDKTGQPKVYIWLPGMTSIKEKK